MKLRTALVALLAVCAAGCNVEKAASQAAARRVMVATLIATPEVVIPAEAIAGFDGGFTLPDAGFVLDAGFLLDAGIDLDGGLVIPAQTAALAFFGERQGDGVSQAPVPLDGAALFVQAGEGARKSLSPDPATGGYALTSLDDPSFVYREGERYQFIATYEFENYVAELDAAPARERIEGFHPPEGYIRRAAGQNFVFLRPDPPEGKDRDLGFVTVVPISPRGERGEPTYTNVPKDALGLLKLVTAPGSYKKTEFTVPGEAFPERDRNYLILMQTARLGGPQSANLFISSAILAGTAEVAIVRTDP